MSHSQQEVASLMMKGLAAEAGVTEEMQTIVAQLKEIQSKAIEKLGDDKGQVAFIAAYTILGVELQK